MFKTWEEEEQLLRQFRDRIQETSDELLIKNTFPFTDDFLLRYLRSRKWVVKEAVERLQNHMKVRRKKSPEIFARLYPSAVKTALETCGARVLKNRDPQGRQILWVRVAAWNPDTVPVDDYLLSLLLFGWEMLSSMETQVLGVVILIDGRGFSVKHARQGTYSNAEKYVNLIVRASPFKCKSAHIVGTPVIFNVTLSLVKMFLPWKLRQRIHLHGNSIDSLHSHLPPDILPSSLGGALGEEEAVDEELHRGLLSNEKDEYYRGFL